MDSLSSREIATILWLGVFFLYALTSKRVRESLLSLSKTLLNWKLVVPFVLLLGYVVAIVILIEKLGIWKWGLLKDTILWFLLTGMALGFSFASQDYERSILKKLILDNIKVVIILEFLVDEYTFSLPLELILIPLVTLIGAIGVMTERKPEDKSVAKFVASFQTLFALWVILFVVRRVSEDFQTLATLDTIRHIILPLLLSISLAPFIYLFSLLSNYELLFLRLKLNSQKETDVGSYAKWRLITHLKWSPGKVRRFAKKYGIELMHIRTKTDVDKLIFSESQAK